jgi:MFS family permease
MPIFNDDRFLAACIVTNTVANIFGTFIWGFLAHKIGNITTVGIVGAITLIGGILGIFSKNHIIVLIFMFVFGVGDRGM